MAIGLFISGVDTEDSVLEIRTTAIERLAAGIEVTSWSSEGTSVTRNIVMPTRELIEECNAFLRSVAPEKYGSIIKRTSPLFRT